MEGIKNRFFVDRAAVNRIYTPLTIYGKGAGIRMEVKCYGSNKIEIMDLPLHLDDKKTDSKEAKRLEQLTKSRNKIGDFSVN